MNDSVRVRGEEITLHAVWLAAAPCSTVDSGVFDTAQRTALASALQKFSFKQVAGMRTPDLVNHIAATLSCRTDDAECIAEAIKEFAGELRDQISDRKAVPTYRQIDHYIQAHDLRSRSIATLRQQYWAIAYGHDSLPLDEDPITGTPYNPIRLQLAIARIFS